MLKIANINEDIITVLILDFKLYLNTVTPVSKNDTAISIIIVHIFNLLGIFLKNQYVLLYVSPLSFSN
jgi:hypothetical protein